MEGNQVEVEWQGTGPNSGGGGRADLFYCTLPGRSTTPCELINHLIAIESFLHIYA